MMVRSDAAHIDSCALGVAMQDGRTYRRVGSALTPVDDLTGAVSEMAIYVLMRRGGT